MLEENVTNRMNEKAKIEHYLEQPTELPQEIVDQLESKWGKGGLRLYAMADLNEKFELGVSWVILGTKYIATALFDEGRWEVESWPREKVANVYEFTGLSANRLMVFDANEWPLFVLRYSHRQSKAMGPLIYALERQIEGEDILAEEFENSADEIYRESSLSSVKEAQNSTSTHRLAVVWRLLGLLHPYRKQVGIGLFGALMLTLVSLVPAFITGYLFDHVIRPHQLGSLGADDAKKIAFLAMGGLVAVYAFRELFAWMRLRWMSVLGELVARDLRKKVYNHLHKLSLSYFSSKQTGSLISRVSSDTDRIWDFVAFGVVEVASSVLMLLGLGGVLLYLDWKLALIVVLPVPLFLWAIARHGKVMQKMFLRIWRRWSDLTDCLSDTIPGIRVVKAFNQENHERAKFNGRNEAFVDEANKIHQAWTSFWPRLMLSLNGMIILVWVFGLPRVLDASPTLTAGTFISFVLYMTMFFQPIEIIGQMARMVNRATSSAHRVFEVLDTEPQLVEVNDPIKIEEIRGHVAFENVTFSYDGVRPVIKKVSFDVQPGEFIGLVGPSGGGKSTLINLMTRFYDVSGGSICIDGVDIRDLDLEGFRDQVGMVLQDPYLFHGTVLENIRYARPEASLDEVIKAAQTAFAHDFICKLTHGYDTLIGERGQTLSGGERQRLSIARAILRNPRILILDEATSAVDTETEFKIQQALDRLVEGRTVFAIAHRLSTLRKADRLFVIKRGQIIEKGTHAELVHKPEGLYAKLHSMQQRVGEAYLM